jgi:hypothetical protein
MSHGCSGSCSSEEENSDSSSVEEPVKKFSLSLSSVKQTGPSYHEVASDFANVDVVLVCPNGYDLLTVTELHRRRNTLELQYGRVFVDFQKETHYGVLPQGQLQVVFGRGKR